MKSEVFQNPHPDWLVSYQSHPSFVLSVKPNEAFVHLLEPTVMRAQVTIVVLISQSSRLKYYYNNYIDNFRYVIILGVLGDLGDLG